MISRFTRVSLQEVVRWIAFDLSPFARLRTRWIAFDPDLLHGAGPLLTSCLSRGFGRVGSLLTLRPSRGAGPLLTLRLSRGFGRVRSKVRRTLLGARLEHARLQIMTSQQLVEVGAVTPGDTRRLGHVAFGDLQHLDQVAALETGTCLGEGRQGVLFRGQRLGDQRFRNHRGAGERDTLLDHIHKLTYVTWPR